MIIEVTTVFNFELKDDLTPEQLSKLYVEVSNKGQSSQGIVLYGEDSIPVAASLTGNETTNIEVMEDEDA